MTALFFTCPSILRTLRLLMFGTVLFIKRWHVRVHLKTYNIVQVNVGSSLNELLHYFQTALLCCHHEGSLSILKQGDAEYRWLIIQYKLNKTSLEQNDR